MKTSLLALMAVLCTVVPASGQEPAPDSVPALLDAGRNRLAFLPTARTLPAGTRWIADQAYVIPSAGIAPTDAFMLGVGAPLLTLAVPRLFVVAPKLRVLHRPGLDVAVGTVSLVAVSFSTFDGLGAGFMTTAAYGVVTVGDEESALTLGAFRGLGQGVRGIALFGGAEVELPALRRKGGEQRVKLLAEVMRGSGEWPLHEPTAAFTVRFFDAHVAVDAAIVVLETDGGHGGGRGYTILPAPMLNLSVLF